MDIRRYFTPSQSKPKVNSENKKEVESKNEPAGKRKTPAVAKRPSLIIDSDSDEAAPSKRSKSSAKNEAEDPLPPSKNLKKTTSTKQSKVSKSSDEDPLPPSKNSKKTTSTKQSKVSKASDEDPLPPQPSKKTKRKEVIEEVSDEEDPLPSKKSKISKRKFFIEDSDDDVDFVQSKPKKKNDSDVKKPKVEEKKLVLDVSDYFGTAPVKRSSNKNEAHVQPTKTLKKEDFFDTQNNNVSKSQVTTKETASQRVETSESKALNKSPIQKSERPLEPQAATPKSNRKSEPKHETTPGSGRKSSNAATYQAFLNRAGPSAPGSKVVPQGADNCFKGLTFVITGVLESLERDEVAEIIKKYGGKVSQSISKNTSYMIVGTEAGPAKLEKAEKLGTKQLTEDSFLNLLRSSSTERNASPDKVSSKKSLFETKDEESQKPNKGSSTQQISPVNKKNDSVHKEITSKNTNVKAEKVLSPVEKSKMRSAVNKEPSEIHRQRDLKSAADTGVTLMWVDKYKPVGTQHIIGQQGPRSNVQKLKNWLSNWFKNNARSDKSKKPNYGRWGPEDGCTFKAALLSGPPGVGKTTTAQLVCKEAGFTFIELNASDTRSKKSLETIVAEMVHNKSLSHLIEGNSKGAHNHCILMDEVDGMAGNEDRGGVQQLIQLIKSSQIPIICMCNDRQHQKIRSLANYCFDLRFQKPTVESLKSAMMTVCSKEGLTISPSSLEDIIIGANQDVRQILHNLSMWTVKDKNLSQSDASKEAKKAKKDIKLNPFEALRLVFSAEAHKTMSIFDKSDLFFYDYSMAGLFVEENYLSIQPEAAANNKSKHIDLISKAADSICNGDLVDKLIRSQGHWNLLPAEAMFASVIPGHYLEGRLTQMVSFPSWLGRNSTRGKNDRILQELHLHTRLRISGSKVDLNCDYLPFLRNAIVSPIVTKLQDGIPDAINVMNEYYLRREDLDSIIDVCTWPTQENPLKKLSPQVKAAFTRAYNKESQPIPYLVSTVAKRTAKVNNDADVDGDDTLTLEEEDDEEEDEITKDTMIKMKVQPKRKNDKKVESSTSTTGKGGRSRKKGKTKS